MTDMTKLSTCQITCWSLSALAGVLIVWATIGSLGVAGGVVLGIVVALVMALLFTKLVCTGYAPGDPGIQTADLKNVLKNATGVTFYKAPRDEEDRHDGTSGSKSVGAPASTDGTDSSRGGEPAPSELKSASRDGGSDAPRPDVGTRPETLAEPRSGQADDLQQFNGVRPKLEAMRHDMGIYHFDQIARRTGAEIACVDENLINCTDRVSRDDWVAWANILIAGGETESSRRMAEDGMR